MDDDGNLYFEGAAQKHELFSSSGGNCIAGSGAAVGWDYQGGKPDAYVLSAEFVMNGTQGDKGGEGMSAVDIFDGVEGMDVGSDAGSDGEVFEDNSAEDEEDFVQPANWRTRMLDLGDTYYKTKQEATEAVNALNREYGYRLVTYKSQNKQTPKQKSAKREPTVYYECLCKQKDGPCFRFSVSHETKPKTDAKVEYETRKCDAKLRLQCGRVQRACYAFRDQRTTI